MLTRPRIEVVRAGWAGELGGGRDRRYEDAGQREPQREVDYGQIAWEIIAEVIATDQAEDEQHGDARGDELPPELATEEGRRAWLARELVADPDIEQNADGGDEAEHEFDAEEIVGRVQGRDGWLLEARRQLDQDRWQGGGSDPRSRSERPWEAGRRLEADLAAEARGNTAYEAYRAQAVVNEQQIVLAAEISTEPIDFRGDPHAKLMTGSPAPSDSRRHGRPRHHPQNSHAPERTRHRG